MYDKNDAANDEIASDNDNMRAKGHITGKEYKQLEKERSKDYHKTGNRIDSAVSKAKRLLGKGTQKEETDDGWYAHREMHGSKGVSKEDWKKGVRLNKDGKRVQTKKEEAELDETKAIKGTHASKSHGAPSISPSKVGYAGKQPSLKGQRLKVREDYAPMEKGATQAHPDEKTKDATSRKQGAEKPKQLKLSKEEWALYDSLSDINKTIFEKMGREQLDRLMEAYRSKRNK